MTYTIDQAVGILDIAVSITDMDITCAEIATKPLLNALAVMVLEHERILRSNESAYLYTACRELLCWLRRGTTAEKAGAKCETLNEAITQAEEAIARYSAISCH